MTERPDLSTSPQHATHDRLLIAALAVHVGDPRTGEHEAARALVVDCVDCRDLLADLSALASAVPTAAIPARPHDFTLTAADAARLRPAGWRRLLGAIGSARDGLSRPLAAGLTTIGLAGLLVATLPTAFGGAASSPVLSTVGSAIGGTASSAAPSAAAPYSTENLEFAPDASDAERDGGLFSGTGDAAMERGGNDDLGSLALDAIRDDRSGMSVLAVLGGAMLILGLGLFALRWTARRFGDS